jgi:methylated-DNA-[protein]-cysteine S-methyltransferase
MQAYRKIQSPIGELTLIGDGNVIEYILFKGAPVPKQLRETIFEDKSAYSLAVTELERYFRGDLTKFTFPYSLTAEGFDKKALLALAKVPYGKTISYKTLAERAGSPQAFRAAGSACANNPLPIVIPCHRVLKADGTLGGFGGGLPMKRQLLDLEKAEYKQ